MGDFYTDPQGRVRPIRGKGAGVFVTGAVLAGVVVAGGGGAAGGGAASSAAGRVVSAKPAARQGQRGEAWRRMRFRTVRNAVREHVECAVHSYGDVREFLLHTPCRSLTRELLVIADGRGGTIVVATYWVRMWRTGDAERLQDLADTYGTGNITPIPAALIDVAELGFSGKYYDSRRARDLVVIAEAEQLTGQPNADVLDAVAEVAAQFPVPKR